MDAINPNVELTEAERIDRLRLIRSDNVGPRGIIAETRQQAAVAICDYRTPARVTGYL